MLQNDIEARQIAGLLFCAALQSIKDTSPAIYNK